MASPLIQLRCDCNNYPWGHTGSKSIAARLCEKTPNTGFKIDESKEYAEMWMGTYPTLPSYTLASGEDLQDILDANPKLLGNSASKFNHTKIPYLPKVLSIAKALPLQIHPNKELSARLHEKHPDQYPDANHKPEIAIALSDFEAFCGWKEQSKIEELFSKLEPLHRYLPGGSAEKIHFNNETLRGITSTILKDSDESIKEVQESLLKTPRVNFGEQTYILDLLPRLQEQYSRTDPGNLVALLTMNYLTLPPKSSVYIPADCPHAYLSGDIIECMARSNNVINTGFCPRADRDSADLFTSTLTFSPHSAEECLLPPRPYQRCSSKGQKIKLYAPPMAEFSMLLVSLGGNSEEEVLEPVQGPSIFICTHGTGSVEVSGRKEDCNEGYIFFVAAGEEVKFESKAGEGLDVYLAFVE